MCVCVYVCVHVSSTQMCTVKFTELIYVAPTCE